MTILASSLLALIGVLILIVFQLIRSQLRSHHEDAMTHMTRINDSILLMGARLDEHIRDHLTVLNKRV